MRQCFEVYSQCSRKCVEHVDQVLFCTSLGMDGGLVGPELLPWTEDMSTFIVVLLLVSGFRNSTSAQLHGTTACTLYSHESIHNPVSLPSLLREICCDFCS